MENRELMYLERRRRGILLKHLAEHLNVSINYVSLYERGLRSFSADMTAKYNSFIINYKK